jgi:hypothetical protein
MEVEVKIHSKLLMSINNIQYIADSFESFSGLPCCSSPSVNYQKKTNQGLVTSWPKIHPHQGQAWSVKQVYCLEGNDMNSILGPGNVVLLQRLGPKGW